MYRTLLSSELYPYDINSWTASIAISEGSLFTAEVRLYPLMYRKLASRIVIAHQSLEYTCILLVSKSWICLLTTELSILSKMTWGKNCTNTIILLWDKTVGLSGELFLVSYVQVGSTSDKLQPEAVYKMAATIPCTKANWTGSCILFTTHNAMLFHILL